MECSLHRESVATIQDFLRRQKPQTHMTNRTTLAQLGIVQGPGGMAEAARAKAKRPSSASPHWRGPQFGPSAEAMFTVILLTVASLIADGSTLTECFPQSCCLREVSSKLRNIHAPCHPGPRLAVTSCLSPCGTVLSPRPATRPGACHL